MKKGTKQVFGGVLIATTLATIVGGSLGYAHKAKASHVPNAPMEDITKTSADQNDNAPSEAITESTNPPIAETKPPTSAQPPETAEEPKEYSYSTDRNDYTFQYENGVTTVTIEMNYGGHRGEYNGEDEDQSADNQPLPDPKDMELYFGNGIKVDHKISNIIRDEKTGILYSEESREIAYADNDTHTYLTGTSEIDDVGISQVYFDPETEITYTEHLKDGRYTREVVYDPARTSPEETTYIMQGMEITGAGETVEYDPNYEGDGRLFIGGVEVTTPKFSAEGEEEMEEMEEFDDTPDNSAAYIISQKNHSR
jgi:hypothetical protein